MNIELHNIEFIIHLIVFIIDPEYSCYTRYKIFYCRHEVHSYNTIYINLNNKIQCITYNDKKYYRYINFSKI